jgi:hypothetical protein
MGGRGKTVSSEAPAGTLLAWSLAAARTQTLALTEDVPDELSATQSDFGEHHPVWVVGHLLLSDSYLLHLLAVEPLPLDFGALLAAYGPEASPGSVDTPALSRLTARLAHTGARRHDAVRSMSTAALARRTPDTALATTQPTLHHHLTALLIHEGYHAGQLSTWRRWRGLPPTRWCLAPASR